MWVRGRWQSTMQTEVCEDRILNNQALFLRLTALGDSGWLWTCRKCYSDRNDNDSLDISCCKGPLRPHSDTADSLWVTNSSENTTVVLLSYSHAKGITNKLSEALSDEQRAREDKSGSHLPWVKSEVSELRRLLTPGLHNIPDDCQSSASTAVSPHSRATPQCLEMGFRMLPLES